MPENATVIQLRQEFQQGSQTAADRPWAEVYDELRRANRHKLRDERQDHTLDTTALVHECYLKLVDQTQVEWQSRLHFFAMAYRGMRNILVDYTRQHTAQKRGGDTPTCLWRIAWRASSGPPIFLLLWTRPSTCQKSPTGGSSAS